MNRREALKAALALPLVGLGFVPKRERPLTSNWACDYQEVISDVKFVDGTVMVKTRWIPVGEPHYRRNEVQNIDEVLHALRSGAPVKISVA